VAVVGGQGRSNVAGPAQPLKPGRDFGVVKIQVVATVGADELEQPADAVQAAVARARRLAPHYCHQAMAQLTRWDYRSVCRFCAWRPAVAMALPLAATAVCVVPLAEGIRCHFSEPLAQSTHRHDKKKMACCRDPNCYRLTMPSWWRDP
jgi:hypothetical protein